MRTTSALRSYRLADLTSPEVDAAAAGETILAVPIGSTEQHGAHLPLATDSDIAVELADRLARARGEVLVAPAVHYGSRGEHAGFAGTMSIGQPALEMLLVELGRSACETFHRVLFVSAHGGNTETVTRAVRRLRAEGRDVRSYSPDWGAQWSRDTHAGRPETSMLLAMRPAQVLMQSAVAGDRRPIQELLPELRAGGVRAVSPNGVLGDPIGATADDGLALLELLSVDLVRMVESWQQASR